MKKSELIFSATLVPVDYGMVLLAGIFSYNLRHIALLTDIRPVISLIDFHQYFTTLVLVPVIYIATFALAGLYAIKITRRLVDELAGIFVASTASIAVVIVIIFFQRELISSRFIVLIGWLLTIVLVMFGRIFVRAVQRSLLRRGIGIHRVVVIGNDSTTQDIVKQLYRNPHLGYRIDARYERFTLEVRESLDALVHADAIDEIMQTDTTLPKDEAIAMKDYCSENHLTFRYATDLFEVQPSNIQIGTVAGIPIIEVKRTKLDGWGRIFKRVADTVGSSVLLLVLSPLFLVVALCIAIDSQGGTFVRLDRVGEHNKRFRLFKFRSMVKNARELKSQLVGMNERSDGPLFKIKNDPRVTRIGRFIRKTSIDELPQLFNVLLGQMSLVGPRPHEPEEVARYERWHKKLLTIKPGMTGLAQISGRSDLKFEDEAKLDIYYIENWSPGLDLQVLIKTPLVVLTGRSAS
ncbi:MAG: sugar transferase [Patescibacteria group bacterium]